MILLAANTYCVGHDSTCPGAGTPCFGGPNQGTAPWLSLYPRMFLMPSGLVYTSSPREELFLFDPSTGRWTRVGQSAFGQYRDYGTSILLPLQNSSSERGKVMVVGGSVNAYLHLLQTLLRSMTLIKVHPPAQTSEQYSPLNRGRKYVLPIILPDGKVVIFGGSAQGNENPVFVPEMFDPENESQGWVNLPAATVPRVYHGTAVLLPDGSVWTAGSTPSAGVWELRIEIFRPSYFFSATGRPTISGAPTVGGYGASITIPTPDAANIARVSLVKTGCQTHHYDTDMRLIWLPITSRGTNTVTVSAPINANIAPPGYYMIHVLDGSLVPSTARIIQISGAPPPPDTTPPTLAITSPANNSTHPAGNVVISGTATDNSGIRDVRVRVDSGAYQTATLTGSNWTITLNITVAGPHTITANARDIFNNFTTRGIAINIGTPPPPDTTPPTLAITSPANNSTHPPGNVVISGTATDNVGGSGMRDVRVRVDSGAYQTATLTGSNWTITLNITAEGPHTITANARDLANNFTTRAIAINIGTPPPPDTTPPTVTITSPDPNATVSSPITVTGTAADNVGS